MALAHFTSHGFLVHSEEADSIEGEGTFTPLPEYDPSTEVPRFVGIDWHVVPLSVRDGYVPPPPIPQAQPVPAEVSPAQAKTALYDAGLYSQVEAILAGTAYTPMRIWWDSALAWRLDNPYIHALAAELDLTDDQVEDLFRQAAKVVL